MNTLAEMPPTDSATTLAVDLDGTLTPSDLLWEQIVRFVARNPMRVVLVITWVLRGKHTLEARIAERTPNDVTHLPLTMSVVDLVNERRAAGAHVVLATASPQDIADAMATDTGMFDEAIGTTDINLRGREKAALLTRRYGAYAYVGHSTVDLPVWQAAEEAITVTRSKALRGRVDALGIPVRHLAPVPRAGLRTWARELRMHQWAKNVLVFVPILAAHRFLQPVAWIESIDAFVAFCALASAVYIWNDLQDLPSDRRHESKRNRPLAAGRIHVLTALVGAVILAAAAIVLASFVGWELLVVLIAYLATNLLYTTWFKRMAIADAIVLGLLYTSRIIAGCAAIGSMPSVWLLGFSFFFFTSLAFMKRYAEVLGYDTKPHGRGYELTDEPLILAFGTSTGGVAVLVATLFIAAPDTVANYPSPVFLWPLIVILIFWLFRAWFITHRGDMHDDPVIFAIKDPVSLALLPICAAFAILAALVK